MPSHDAQHTDAINTAPLVTATKPGDDLRVSNPGSLQEIARKRNPDGGEDAITGEGNEPVTANVQAGR